MKQGFIDFHTHAFPEEIAAKAMKTLIEEGQKKSNVTAHLDGRISSLLSGMDKNNIEKSIVCSIATRPQQFASIISWSATIRSERIIPFPSFHPDDPDFADRIIQIKNKGFSGIKFHPYYQGFTIDDEKVFPIYEKICEQNLIVVMHTGFDLAFDRNRICDPEKIVRVMSTFPQLKMVTTHLGAWEDWDEVEKWLVGKNIFMEISYALDLLDREKARRIILNHPSEYVLFGTDSPWTGQDKTLSLLKGLDLGEELEENILRNNAVTLLNSV
jgi:predicted TIM-barrel fold metal-dependent hydrolase